MPFITGYISNEYLKDMDKEYLFQCPLSRATFQTGTKKDESNANTSVSMPFITGYISNCTYFVNSARFNRFNALYHGLHFKPWLWECPYLLGLKVTLRGNLNFFLLTYHFTFEMCHKPSKYKYRGKFCIC